MKVYICDEPHCEVAVELPIMVLYPGTEDEDNDVDIDDNEAHFCSWTCLATWAMREALEQGDTVA